MEYQKVINLLDHAQNQPSKSMTKIEVEINDGSRGTYNTDRKIKLNLNITLQC